jgi:hypothetical protein
MQGFNTIGANVQQNHYQDPYGEIEETNATWAQRMRENLEHMDQENNGFVHTFRFLDIGFVHVDLIHNLIFC